MLIVCVIVLTGDHPLLLLNIITPPTDVEVSVEVDLVFHN